MREVTKYGERKAKSNSLNPKRKYFIFFEGIVTEVQYFNGVESNKKRIGINQLININVLGRREDQAQRANIRTIINDVEFIKTEDNGVLSEFEIKNDDRIWIIFDRDNLTEEQIEYAIEYIGTNINHYLGFTNPCFELWLLLHYLDVSLEPIGEKQKILENVKESNNYNYIGRKLKNVNEKAISHGKHIQFKYYINKINVAIENESKLENEIHAMMRDIGSNIGMLIQELKS